MSLMLCIHDCDWSSVVSIVMQFHCGWIVAFYGSCSPSDSNEGLTYTGVTIYHIRSSVNANWCITFCCKKLNYSMLPQLFLHGCCHSTVCCEHVSHFRWMHYMSWQSLYYIYLSFLFHVCQGAFDMVQETKLQSTLVCWVWILFLC